MAVSLAEFWKRLIASGLADPSTPRDWAARFVEDSGGKPPTDVPTLAKWLVKTKRLLPFQASILVRGGRGFETQSTGNTGQRPLKLRIAPITQNADAATEAMPFWLPVTRDATDNDPSRDGYLLQISPDRITPVDGDRLRTLVATRQSGLPAMELLGLPGGPLGDHTTSLPIDQPADTVGIFVAMPPGCALAEKLKQKSKWPDANIVGWITDIADAISQMARFAVNGMPLPTADRVWISDGGKAIFAIEPVELLSHGVFDFASSFHQSESPLLYTPPERFGVDASSPVEESSIVYALGCLAYRLRNGSHLFAAAKDQQIRSRHLNFDPPELRAAVEKGADGDPMFRVLAFALAKDPSSRFGTVEQFSTALRAVVPKASVPEATVSNVTAAGEVRRPKPSSAASKKTSLPESPESSPKTDTPKPKRPTKTDFPAKRTAETIGASTQPAATPPPAAPAIPEAVFKDTSEQEVNQQEVAQQKVIQQEVIEQNSSDPAIPSTPPNDAEPLPPEADISLPVRRRPSRRRGSWIVLHCLWVPIVLLIVLHALQGPPEPRIVKRIRPPIPAILPSVTGRPRSESTRPASTRSTATRSTATRPANIRPKLTTPTLPPAPTSPPTGRQRPASIEVVESDQMLWAPPMTSETSSIADGNQAEGLSALQSTILLPPGPGAIVTIDLNQLRETGLLRTFDPEISPLFDRLQKRIVVPLDDVKLIAMGWYAASDGIPGSLGSRATEGVTIPR